jgi:hypothetical protein
VANHDAGCDRRALSEGHPVVGAPGEGALIDHGDLGGAVSAGAAMPGPVLECGQDASVLQTGHGSLDIGRVKDRVRTEAAIADDAGAPYAPAVGAMDDPALGLPLTRPGQLGSRVVVCWRAVVCDPQIAPGSTSALAGGPAVSLSLTPKSSSPDDDARAAAVLEDDLYQAHQWSAMLQPDRDSDRVSTGGVTDWLHSAHMCHRPLAPPASLVAVIGSDAVGPGIALVATNGGSDLVVVQRSQFGAPFPGGRSGVSSSRGDRVES